MRRQRVWASLVLAAFAALPAHAQPTRHHATEPVASNEAMDIAEFRRRAAMERELGATQISVTEGLPVAMYELDPDDPYPAWFAHHASLFKIFPPSALRPFVDTSYARRVQAIVRERCQVLAADNLGATWSANEPAVLPEAFFVAHPQYRGPRIDQVTRSRKIYFAPNVDHPDVLRMYRQSVAELVQICPQIDTFLWVTTDAGSGFAWTPGLYPGANGNSDGAQRSIAARVVGFMNNIEQAATDAGHPVRINITQIEPRQWMIPTFGPDVLENIVRQLPRGLAVNGREGPDGRVFDVGNAQPAASPFYPIVGLTVPSFEPVPSRGERRGFPLGEDDSVDFNYRLYKATQHAPMGTALERLTALRAFAVSEAGETQADNLVEAWRALNDVRQYLNTLDFGGMLRFGHVLNRWIERPMVPYPLELTAQEKSDWRPFLFQARGDEQAADLADIQAMRMYEGWGAHLLFQRTIELAAPRAERARALFEGIAAAAPERETRARWTLAEQRTQALIYLLRSADDMVAYQAQLDRVTALGVTPEQNPVLGVQSDWARTDMINLARREIDTTVALDDLLGQASGPILDLAPTAAQETIMRLGPNLRDALAHKVRTMNNHWRDYDRLFVRPNP